MLKPITIPALALSLSLTPVPSFANDFVGGLVGGIIGSAIVNSKPKRSSGGGISSATREQNRQVQTSLNYFGFNAGGADGVLGSRSRAAISAFQAHMGYPPTGRLSPFEQDFLINSYYRAQSGGPTTAELIASNPQGVRGLLIVYRDEQMNGGSGGNAIAGHYGLPKEVAASVNEIAKSSDPSAEQLVQRHGFVQLADINGDGATDYILDTSVTGSAFWCSAQACVVRVFASTPQGYARNDFQAFNVTPAMFQCTQGTCIKTDGGATTMVSTQPVAPAPQQGGTVLATAPVASAVPSVQAPAQTAAAPALPNLFGEATAPQERSLASHCNMVNLMTTTNGGFVTAATMTSADTTLSEQMCLTRSLAIVRGEELVARLQGVTTQQIDQQCSGFGDAMRDSINAVALKDRAEVMRGVSSFILSTGMSPQQMENTAVVCLASGYRTDNNAVSIGSALLLTALGKAPYAELIGHHLSQGFGTSERIDLASGWYGHAINAIASGTPAVFAPGQPERMELLQMAVSALPGGAASGGTAATTQTALPTFVISE